MSNYDFTVGSVNDYNNDCKLFSRLADISH